MSWITEFGEDYNVPLAVLRTVEQIADFEDLSWHNEACPTFGTPLKANDFDSGSLQLWIEHPRSKLRENTWPRFLVTESNLDPILSYEKTLYNGDDVETALDVFIKRRLELREER